MNKQVIGYSQVLVSLSCIEISLKRLQIIIIVIVIKDLFYLFERQREAETEREAFHPLVHSPDGCNSWSCGEP